MNIIGIDLGGTNIEAGIVSDGKLLSSVKISTEAEKGKAKVLENIFSAVESVKKEADISGIGVGIPGLVKNGKIYDIPNISCLKNTNIKKELEKRFKVKTDVLNDAKCFILGEHKFDAAKGKKNVIGLTLGTGVGGGIIINDELYLGTGSAGELGHMIIVERGDLCSCGKKGCLEAYIGKDAIMNRYEKLTGNKKDVDEISKEHSKAAKRTLAETGRYLGIGLANIVNIFAPEMIVLGGGISNSKQIISSAIKEMRKTAFRLPASKVKIVKSRLKSAAVLGAASLIS